MGTVVFSDLCSNRCKKHICWGRQDGVCTEGSIEKSGHVVDHHEQDVTNCDSLAHFFFFLLQFIEKYSSLRR